jgi:3-isopropylmalate dehydratase small subunit
MHITVSLVNKENFNKHCTWTDFKKPPFMHFFITVSHTEAGVPGSREATFTALTKTGVCLIITPTTMRIILTVTACLVVATTSRTVGSP